MEAYFYLGVILVSFVLLIYWGLASAREGLPFDLPLIRKDEGLSEKVGVYIGTLVYVKPHHGYGWSYTPDSEQKSIYGPEPFQLRFERFTTYSSRGKRRGGIGRVEQPGHALDGQWVAFVPRWMGSWNFTSNIGPCNIIIGPQEPVETESIWESMPDAENSAAGFCEIGVSPEDLERAWS